MIEEFSELLSIHNIFSDDYKIITESDIFNQKKINFYYFLFKYIFQNLGLIFYLSDKILFLNQKEKQFFYLNEINKYFYKKIIKNFYKIIINRQEKKNNYPL